MLNKKLKNIFICSISVAVLYLGLTSNCFASLTTSYQMNVQIKFPTGTWMVTEEKIHGDLISGSFQLPLTVSGSSYKNVYNFILGSSTFYGPETIITVQKLIRSPNGDKKAYSVVAIIRASQDFGGSWDGLNASIKYLNEKEVSGTISTEANYWSPGIVNFNLKNQK